MEQHVLMTARLAVFDIAHFLRNDMIARTSLGRSPLGQFTKVYSESYAKRVKNRRQPVTLVKTGEMMDALQVEPLGDMSYRVGYSGGLQEIKARSHHFGAPNRKTGGVNRKPNKLPERPWFGVSDEARLRARKQFTDRVVQAVEELNFPLETTWEEAEGFALGIKLSKR